MAFSFLTIYADRCDTVLIGKEEVEEFIKSNHDKLLDLFKGAHRFSNQTVKRRISREPDERNQAP